MDVATAAASALAILLLVFYFYVPVSSLEKLRSFGACYSVEVIIFFFSFISGNDY